MKIANEVKIGGIAIAAIILLIVGFSFLKGKKLFSDDTMLIANYNNVQGLQPSNPVNINGMQVGTVYRIVPDKYMRNISVELNISKNINIPANSIAIIKSNPLGTTGVDIMLGDGASYLKNNDTIITETSQGVFSEVLKKVDPVLYEVRKAVTSIDTLVGNFNTTLDPNAKRNIGATLEHMNFATASLMGSSAALQRLLENQNGALYQSLNNMNAITRNLAAQNDKISSMMTNLNTTSANLSQLDLQRTMNKLDAAATQLQALTEKLNDTKGSLGKLLNDPSLYQNFASSGNKLNLLLDDIRLHPKRYVSISVFGKKGTPAPLVVPLPDTINSPYFIETIDKP